MNKTGWGAIALVLTVITSLLAGVYIDLVVHKVGSWGEIIDAFGVHLDFARSEKWRGYRPDQERNGEWKIHNDDIDITSFVRTNRIIGSTTDKENLPSWNITGYTKSDSKFIVFTGEDVGAGFYLLKAFFGGIPGKNLTNTIFVGFSFGWNSDDNGILRFRKCPYAIIREVDVHDIKNEDVLKILPAPKTTCENLTFPGLEPESR